MSGPGVKHVLCSMCGSRFPVADAEWFDVDLHEPYYTAACTGCVQGRLNVVIEEEMEDLLGCLRDLAEDDEDPRAARAANLLETFEHRGSAAAKVAAAPFN